jgi:hypothetical protein
LRFSVVSTVAVLFAATSSSVVDDTLATFTIGPRPGYVIGKVKVAVIVRVAPAGTTPSAHGNAVVQSPVVDTNTRPVGAASLTTTPAASDGPALVMVIV